MKWDGGPEKIYLTKCGAKSPGLSWRCSYYAKETLNGACVRLMVTAPFNCCAGSFLVKEWCLALAATLNWIAGAESSHRRLALLYSGPV